MYRPILRALSVLWHCLAVFSYTLATSPQPYDAEAREHYRALFMENPHDLTIAQQYAYALAYSHHDIEALHVYTYILKHDPTLLTIFNNIGFLLTRAERIEPAIEMFQHALRDPSNAAAHFNLAIAYLTQGELEKGFYEYEWRWRSYGEPAAPLITRGDFTHIAGKKICVCAEQGFGDTFMFIRYLVVLKEQGAHIVFIAQPELIPLLSHCPYIDTLLTYNDPVPVCDNYCMLLSLPYICKTELKTIPVPIPYLYADSDLMQAWKEYMAGDLHCKVGICWRGKKQQTSCTMQSLEYRSCDVEYFKTIAEVPGVTVYSLHRKNDINEFAGSNTLSSIHFSALLRDEEHGRFMDTAALIKNLDLVITIDTSIAHLAGALGITTWLLLPKPADWRWMLERTYTPWYPNMRIFRQEKSGDWNSVFTQVAEALDTYVYEHQYQKIKQVLYQ